jgi:hypothetical protein
MVAHEKGSRIYFSFVRVLLPWEHDLGCSESRIGLKWK